MKVSLDRRQAVLGIVTAVAAGDAWKGSARAQARRDFNIFFDFGRTDVTGAARDILKLVAGSATSKTRLLIEGHCDAAEEKPERLGLDRAISIVRVMAEFGLPDGASATLVSRGRSQPLVKTAAGAREPQNRRVLITVS